MTDPKTQGESQVAAALIENLGYSMDEAVDQVIAWRNA